MSLRTFIKIATKAIKWATIRPLQRFNVASRSVKYLGPDAKYYKPAPRAIGAMSRLTGKPPQYPHIEAGGFFSLRQKRLEAIEKGNSLLNDPQVGDEKPKLSSKAFSARREDDNLVRAVASKLDVLKTVIKLSPPTNHGRLNSPQPHGHLTTQNSEVKPARPLPKLTSLRLQDLNTIWEVDKVPEGRLDLSSFQELMINKLADREYWTPERIEERYKIKPEYASLLTKYVQQMRIAVSPAFKNALDYVCHKDPIYQATKDILYVVDFNLRSENDKKYDKTFLPEEEELDEYIKCMLTKPDTKPLEVVGSKQVALYDVDKLVDRPKSLERPRKPEPLRLSPINKSRVRSQ